MWCTFFASNIENIRNRSREYQSLEIFASDLNVISQHCHSLGSPPVMEVWRVKEVRAEYK